MENLMRRIGLAVAFGIALGGCLLASARAEDKKKEVKVSAEMKDFMKHLDGTEKGVAAALKKHAADGVDTSAIAGIQVREPKATKVEMKDGQTCYTMAVKTGILDRTYLVCWKDKKIRKIKQLSIK
jgi:hypothetical protein